MSRARMDFSDGGVVFIDAIAAVVPPAPSGRTRVPPLASGLGHPTHWTARLINGDVIILADEDEAKRAIAFASGEHF